MTAPIIATGTIVKLKSNVSIVKQELVFQPHARYYNHIRILFSEAATRDYIKKLFS